MLVINWTKLIINIRNLIQSIMFMDKNQHCFLFFIVKK